MNLLKNLLTIVAVVLARLVLRAFARLFWAVADPALQHIGEQLFRFASLSRGFRAFSRGHRWLRLFVAEQAGGKRWVPRPVDGYQHRLGGN